MPAVRAFATSSAGMAKQFPSSSTFLLPSSSPLWLVGISALPSSVMAGNMLVYSAKMERVVAADPTFAA